jgi:hypothetical protein
MVGEGEDLEALLLCPIDQPFGGVRNGIVGIFTGVEMKIGLQGRRDLYFSPLCFTQA